MIILVTGGTGFIGSNLCSELVKNKENHVICLDNNFTGNLNNIQHLRNLPIFEFIRHDVCQEIPRSRPNLSFSLPCLPKDYQLNSIKNH